MADYKKRYSTSHALSMLMEKWTKVLANNLFEKATPVFLSKVFHSIFSEFQDYIQNMQHFKKVMFLPKCSSR